jgi:hypothetical protein
MKPIVFIETTIPSFYFEARTSPAFASWAAFTRRWWDVERHKFQLVTSRAVLAEVSQTPGQKGRDMLALLDEVEVYAADPRLAGVIREYLRHRLMPADAEGDAAHLASASLAGAEFLLTWNCQHLANPNKVRHIEVVNRRLALQTPILCTPHTIGSR